MRSSRPSQADLREVVIRHRSEGDHLSKGIGKLLAQRKARQEQIAREIYSSRSLFDSRVVPPSPAGESVDGSSQLKLALLRLVRIVQHYFIPLQLGILTAMIWANFGYDSYTSIWLSSDPHALTVHFFVNDVFMALFFGVAMVHVTTALLPGGSLFPLKKALSPLLGTLGGVVGPAAIYLSLVAIQGTFETQSKGWAICIATDISIAWLAATQIFGSGSHPAVQFLLLLAVMDDVIGLVVIAIAFPTGDMHPIWLLLVLGSIAISLTLRFLVKVEGWWYYVFLAGPVAWYSLYRSGVHPALALCLVVPFIPASNLHRFDHHCSLLVHIGLFFFALCNAGVVLNEIGLATLNVVLALVFGKALGIFTFTFLGTKLFGLTLPERMHSVDLALVATVSGVGLTVALFVAEMAFQDKALVGQAKLGALMSTAVAPLCLGVKWLLNKRTPVRTIKFEDNV